MDRNQTIRYTPRRQGWPEETVSPPRPARPRPSPQLRRRRRQLRRMKAAALLLFLLVLLAAATQNALNGDRSSPTDSPDPVSQPVAAEQEGWNLILVNKWNPIPEGYAPELVTLPGGQKVDKRIYDPLMEMLEAAREGNLDQPPIIASGYRTQKQQQQLYDEKIARCRQEGCSQQKAQAQAEQWVAVPGYSEHQLGLAVDLNGATYDLYLWLQENSYRYGFIFRYPGSKTELTGTAQEVWHYRYVGVEAAQEIYTQGLCLEEYLA